MFKFIFLLVATSAVGCESITPEGLQVTWTTIEQDVKLRYSEALNEINNMIQPAIDLVSKAKENFEEILKDANAIFYETMNEQQQKYENSSWTQLCIQSTTDTLETFDEEILDDFIGGLNELLEKIELTIELSVNITNNALPELEIMQEKVEECDDDGCASELQLELVEFYKIIVADFNDILEFANNLVLMQLPEDLERVKETYWHPNQYNDTIVSLVKALNTCLEEELSSTTYYEY